MNAPAGSAPPHTRDSDFLAELSSSVAEYFRAVDGWEAEYRRYYRMPGASERVSSDMQECQRAYNAAKRKLETLVPRTRRMSSRFGIRDPWTGLLRTSLGQQTPQGRTGSAISRTERAAVQDCLNRLAAACEDAERVPDAPLATEREPGERRSLWRRVVDFFF
jgi:hypothetical protein